MLVRLAVAAMSFSNRILVGLAGGVLVGLFLGERAAALELGGRRLRQAAADDGAAVRHGVDRRRASGSLRLRAGAHARHAGRRGAGRALWLVALVFTFLIPLAFPQVQTATFFSTTLVERRPPFNFVDLYIPSNPFNSLANNVVPAVVLFSVVLGVALIGVERKQTLLDVLRGRRRGAVARRRGWSSADALRPLRHRRDRGRHAQPRAARAAAGVSRRPTSRSRCW